MIHDPDGCEECLLLRPAIECRRRCGNCCEHLLIEATLRDGEREPRVAQCPTITGITETVEGYLLNGKDGACTFFNRETRECAVYPTRPLVCRLFRCDLPGSPSIDDDADRGEE